MDVYKDLMLLVFSWDRYQAWRLQVSEKEKNICVFLWDKNSQFTLALSDTRSHVGPVNDNLTAVRASISS
jgi:hypothetical protein